MPKTIKFGTDGWRGITADDFTFNNVLLVAESIRKYLNAERPETRPILIGYDTRFLASEFAQVAAHHFSNCGMSVAVAPEPIPTPAIAFAVKHLGASGAIQFTASHNPYYYNGLKFIPDFAGPAMPETTDAITANIKSLTNEGFRAEPVRDRFEQTFSIREKYFEQLDGLVETDAMAKAGMRILYNALWGTGAGWLDAYLSERGIPVETMNANRDVLFGGEMPDPNETILQPMRDRIRQEGLSLGVATDGDSDRFAAFDKHGNFMSPNQLLPIIAHYLIAHRGLSGNIVRTVVTSSMLDAIAKKHGREIIETPVGFKYIGNELRKGALCGGEESGGFSMVDHVPEKDGILANLLMCEAAAVMGDGDISACLEMIHKEYGPRLSRRNDLNLTDVGKNAVMENANMLAEHFKERGGELWGMLVKDVVTIDGVKFVLENDQSIAMRPSGTEPVVRVYLEAPNADLLDGIDDKVSKWVEATAEE